MSSEAPTSNWFTVKQFVHRQQQRYGVHSGKCEKTVDEYVVQSRTNIQKYESASRTIHETANALSRNIAEFHTLMSTLKDQFALVASTAEEYELTARRMDLLMMDLKTKVEPVCAELVQTAAPLEQYIKNTWEFQPLYDDRKKRLLEYDYFQNKLKELKAKGKDQEKIARNEIKAEDARVAYNEINERTRNFCSDVLGRGAVLMGTTCTTLINTVVKYIDDCGRTTKAVFPQNSAVGATVGNVISAASGMMGAAGGLMAAGASGSPIQLRAQMQAAQNVAQQGSAAVTAGSAAGVAAAQKLQAEKHHAAEVVSSKTRELGKAVDDTVLDTRAHAESAAASAQVHAEGARARAQTAMSSAKDKASAGIKALPKPQQVYSVPTENRGAIPSPYAAPAQPTPFRESPPPPASKRGAGGNPDPFAFS